MKTKKIFLISALLLLSATLMACSFPVMRVVKGSGTLATETRSIGDFNAIQLDGAGQLVITQGDTVALQIEAEDNILPNLKSTVEGSTLVWASRTISGKNRFYPLKPSLILWSSPT